MCLLKGSKRRRKEKRLEKMVATSDKHLDIRCIVKTRLDLKLLISRLLTKEQIALFRMQRERLVTCNETATEGTSSSENLTDDPMATKKLEKEFAKLNGFAPRFRLYRRLLRGLIGRKKPAIEDETSANGNTSQMLRLHLHNPVDIGVVQPSAPDDLTSALDLSVNEPDKNATYLFDEE